MGIRYFGSVRFFFFGFLKLRTEYRTEIFRFGSVFVNSVRFLLIRFSFLFRFFMLMARLLAANWLNVDGAWQTAWRRCCFFWRPAGAVAASHGCCCFFWRPAGAAASSGGRPALMLNLAGGEEEEEEEERKRKDQEKKKICRKMKERGIGP